MRSALLLCRLAVATVAVTVVSQAAGVDLVGYLPYYRLSSSYITNTLPTQLSMLDEVRYFGLSVDSDAGIVPLAGSLQSHKDNIATIQAVIESLPADERPRLDITLGGAGQDATFTSVAANASKRTLLAENINSLLGETGATSVDINWEHPDAGIQRSSQYPALLKRIKQEIGQDRGVHATVAPSVIISNDIFTGPDAIDGVSIMTYDLGWWSNDPSNPNNGEHSLQEYAEDTAAAWTETPGSPNYRPWVFGSWGNSSPASQLGIALPFYGRALSNQTAYTYSELATGGSTTDGEYYLYNGQQVWSPSPELVAERVEFAYDAGLQHVIIWEIAQDLPPTNPASLLKAAFDAREAIVGLPGDFNGDGTVDASDYTVWRDGLGVIYEPTDYDLWLSNYGAAAPPTTFSVPEPAATVWIGLMAAAVVSRRRRVG